MAVVNGRIFKKPKTQRKVKINPYTGNYHLCQSRSATISRNIELLDLTGDKYTKRFTGLVPNRLGASTTTPSTLADPSQQYHRSPDANNNNKENLMTKQTTATAVKTDTKMKHEKKERKNGEETFRKRCKKSKRTSPKRWSRSLSQSESEYKKELEQLLKS